MSAKTEQATAPTRNAAATPFADRYREWLRMMMLIRRFEDK